MPPKWFWQAEYERLELGIEEFAPECKAVDFPVGAYYGKDARTLTPAEPKSSTANSPRSCSCATQIPVRRTEISLV